MSRLEGSGQGSSSQAPCLPPRPACKLPVNSYPPAPRGSCRSHRGHAAQTPCPGPLTLTLPSGHNPHLRAHRGSPQEPVLTPWVLPQAASLSLLRDARKEQPQRQLRRERARRASSGPGDRPRVVASPAGPVVCPQAWATLAWWGGLRYRVAPAAEAWDSLREQRASRSPSSARLALQPPVPVWRGRGRSQERRGPRAGRVGGGCYGAPTPCGSRPRA